MCAIPLIWQNLLKRKFRGINRDQSDPSDFTANVSFAGYLNRTRAVAEPNETRLGI
jgi:hypothetical protein